MCILTYILIAIGIINICVDIFDYIYSERHDWDNDLGYQQWKVLHKDEEK